MTSIRSWAMAALFGSALGLCAQAGASRHAAPPAAMPAAFDMGLTFERNQGQSDPQVRFLSRGPGYTLFLTDEEAVWRVRGDDAEQVLRMQLVGGRALRSAGERSLQRQHHYFDLHAGTPRATRVPTYGATRFSSVWPGVDLVYYGRDGELEYDFELAPGVDPRAIALRFEGGTPQIADDGSLLLTGGAHDLRMKPPVSYQVIGGERRIVESRYALHEGTIGFALGDYDRRLRLTIDPVFAYASYLGGSAADRGHDVVVNAAGEAYVTGYTGSSNFPLVNALDTSFGGGTDAYVTKFSADGSSVLFSTFLGGPAADVGHAIALDPDGSIYITGSTQTDLGGTDTFELKLNATASQLIYSNITVAGDYDVGSGIAADAAGNAYVVGTTHSADFPLLNAIQPTYLGGSKGFLRKVGPTGTTLTSTYLGSTAANTEARGVALDDDGNIFIGGFTQHTDPNYNGFVLKLGPTGATFGFVGEFGGSADDRAYDVAVTGAGQAYLVGRTYSGDLPISGGFDTVLDGTTDGFIARFDDSGNLLASTYFGGAGLDDLTSVAIASDGRIISSGTADQTGPAARATAIRVSANLAALQAQAKYGSGFAATSGVDVDGAGNAYVVSYSADNMPTTAGAYQTARPGGQNGHLAKIGWSNPVIMVADRTRPEGHSGTTSADVFVSVTANNAGDVGVGFATANGSATAGSDYVAATGTVVIPSGTLSVPVSLSILGDTVDEPNETFLLNLSAPVNATIADSQAVITITDDDQPNGEFTIDACSVDEGAGEADVSVRRNDGSYGAVSVDFSTLGSSAGVADFDNRSGTLSWADGNADPQSFSVTIHDDALDESNEEFIVSLANATGGAIISPPGNRNCTILDDDPTPSLTINDRSITEGTGGTKSVAFTVSLSAASGRIVGVNWTTTNGSATAPADYAAGSGSLSFSPGQISRTIPRSIVTDALDEPNETFFVDLSNAVNATIADAQGRATINDDDAPPNVSVGDCSVLEGAGGTANCRFRVHLSAVSGRTVNVNWAVARAAENALGNGDFESPSITGNFVTYPAPQTLGAWTVSLGAVDLVRNLWTPATGAQSLELNGGQPGILEQTFENPGPSRISLAYTANPGCGPGVKSMNIGMLLEGQTYLLEPDATGLDYGNMGWQWIELAGSPKVGSELMMVGSAIVGACGAVVDDIVVVPADIASPPVDLAWSTGAATIAAGATQSALIDIPVRGDTLEEIDEHFAIVVTGGSNFGNATPGVGTILTDEAPPGIFCDGFETAACMQ